MRRGAAGVALAVMWLAGLSACTARGAGEVVPTGAVDGVASPTGAVDGVASPTGRGPRLVQFPLDAYAFTDQEQATILLAQEILVTSCMAGYGMRFAGADVPYPGVGTVWERRNPYALDDPSQGYTTVHTPREVEAEAKDQANNDYLNSLPPASEAYNLVLNGRHKRTEKNIPAHIGDAVGGKEVYPTGCYGWASEQIDPDAAAEQDPAWLKDSGVGAQVEGDPRVLGVDEAWAQCMAAAGYHYAKPRDAGNDATNYPSDNPGDGPQREVVIATADDACRASTGYAETMVAVQTELENAFIERHAAELTQLRAQYDDIVRRAADVVAKSGAAS